MTEGVTIYRIAEEAGVSPSTAAKILSGRSKGRPHTREAVLAAAERLGYRPNFLAQSLSRGRSNGVGVLVQDMSSFHVEVLRGVEEGLRGSAYHPVSVSSHWRLDPEHDVLDILLAHRVAAIVVIGAQTPGERLAEVARQIPIVVTNRTVGALPGRCLNIDNVAAAALATRHLIDLGHRQILHLSGPSWHPDAAERRAGFALALHEAGLPVDPLMMLEGDFEDETAHAIISAKIARGETFTAIFAANDAMAHGARLALYEAGLRVPEDVSLVGFDDMPYSALATPPLTTVRQPARAMGLLAARAITALLADDDFKFPAVETELIVRQSTGPAASGPASGARRPRPRKSHASRRAT